MVKGLSTIPLAFFLAQKKEALDPRPFDELRTGAGASPLCTPWCRMEPADTLRQQLPFSVETCRICASLRDGLDYGPWAAARTQSGRRGLSRSRRSCSG